MSSDVHTQVNKKCWYLEVCSKVGKECYMCRKFLEMSYLMENSWLPKNRQTIPPKLKPTTSHDKEMFLELNDIRMSIDEFVRDGKNLYITSNCTGNGKTTWAIKLLLKYFEKVWDGNGLKVRGIFAHVPTLILRLKNFDNKLPTKDYENLKECDLVIWDDIAFTNLTSYDYTQLMALIDYRMLAGKSNIYTSNIPKFENLEEIIGNRLASRIYNASEIIEFDGGDNR